MTVAGDIVANLTVNSKGWSSGLKDAITPLTAFSTAVLGMAAAGVYKFNEIGSAIDDMSQRTGLSAEMLGGLNYAAQQTDTSLDSLQAGLVKQSKFMETLDSGSSSATATLNRLGISAEDLAGKTADERFMIFADRLSRITDVGERTAVAMQIFGKGAVDLVPLLSQGGDGIQELIDRAEKLGLIMSNDDVKAAAEFGDSLDELTLAGQMLLVKVVSPLIPLLTDAAVFVSNLVGENREWITVMVQAGGAIGVAVASIQAVNLATQAYTKSVVIMQSLSGPKGWAVLAAGAAIAGGALYALHHQQESVNAKFADSTEAIEATAVSTSALNQRVQGLTSSTANSAAAKIADADASHLAAGATSSLNSRVQGLTSSTANSAAAKIADADASHLAAGATSSLNQRVQGLTSSTANSAAAKIADADANRISARTLAGLGYAAQQAGTSFESLKTGLIAQSGFMELLERGSSSATATLDRLRLSAGDVVGKTADQQLKVFANALAKVEDVGERSALSLLVFGTRSGEIVPLLNQGGEGIQKLIDRAAALGITLAAPEITSPKIDDPFTKLETSISKFSANVQPAVSTFVDLFAEGIDFVAPYVESFLTQSAHMLNNFADNAKMVFGMLRAGGEVVAGIASGISRAGQIVLDPVGFLSWAFGAEEATQSTQRLEAATQSAAVAKIQDRESTQRQAEAYKALDRNIKEADQVHGRLNKQLQTPAEQAIDDARKLADEWWKASRAGSQLGMRFEDLKRLQAKTLEEKSGFTGMFTDVTNELRVLRGEITETELKFEQMAEFGVSDTQIQKLREANAERDRLLAEQQQRKDEESAAANRISNIQKTVRDSFGTPLDDFIEKAKGVEDAIKAGALTKAEGNQYLEAERQKLLEESAKQLETPEQRKAAITEAISVNSDTANRMMVDLLNRKGGGQTLDEKQLALQQQQKKLAEQTLEVMQDVKENTSKPQLITKPFRGGR